MISQVAGRIVGRAHIDESHGRCHCRQHRGQLQAVSGLGPQRHFDHCRALDPRGDRVHAKGGWGDQHRIAPTPRVAPGQKIDGLVASAAGEHRVGVHLVELRQPLGEFVRVRLGVAVEPCLARVQRRAPRQLVGVQAHQPRLPGGMLIGLQRQDLRPRDTGDPGHAAAPPASAARRTLTAAACASRPSSRASVIATGPRAARPAALSSCTLMLRRKSPTDRPLYARAWP